MKDYILKNDHEKFFIYTEKYKEIIYKKKNELMDIKCKIDTINPKKWEKAKKFLNDFEYIYTSSNKNKNICKVSPVSRSYFKIYEIFHDIIGLKMEGITSCIAEGPGGFIHCINDISNMKVYGITLISNTNKNIPFWNSLIINNNKNTLSYGKDNTGDIYNIGNANYYIYSIKNKCDIVTADGGFDYSKNYNLQEESSYRLLFSEIYIALNVQKINGSFTIKFFDLFNYKTIQLVYILYLNYEKIHIYKPTTSRLSNSEKYIVCTGFTPYDKKITQLMEKYYNSPDKFTIQIPQSFINNIMDFNGMFIDTQVSTIKRIISTKENNFNNKPTDHQIKSAIEWCQKYKLPINKNCIYL